MWLHRAVVLGCAVALLLAGSSVGVTAAPVAESAIVAAPPPAAELEIVAVGDLTLGRDGLHPPGGPVEVLDAVDHHVRASVSLGNLETALVDDPAGARVPSKCGAQSSDCHAFRAPERFARGLRASGFTILNLANNHSSDYGAFGRARTVAALTRAGLRSTGAPGQVTLMNVSGTRIAVVGFAPYASSANLLDLRAARLLVRSAAGRAQVVIVTMHIGAEGTDRMHVPTGAETYLGERRGDSRAFSHAVVDAGADLVIGHGPHVVRGLEWYRGRLIAHSLGNFSGHHTLLLAGDLAYGAILRVTLGTDGEFIRARVVPIKLVGTGAPIRDPQGRSITLVRRLSSADFGGFGARLDALGRVAPPVP